MQAIERTGHLLSPAHDANKILHHFLQVVLNLVRAFAIAAACERFEGFASRLFDLAFVDLAGLLFLCEPRSELPGAFAKDE